MSESEAKLTDGSSFEILPYDRGEEEAASLPHLVRLTVACSPQKGVDHSILVARRLRTLNHSVTVHLAARLVRSRLHVEEILQALADAGVDELFLIGGDVPRPHGPFSSALELLPIVDQHACRPRRIGIAGYPEGHPLIAPLTLQDVLKKKSRHADYITTQLCFQPRAVLAWVRAIRSEGIGLPVIVGVPGIVERRKLLEIAVRIGVGPSLSFLKRQGAFGSLMRMSASSTQRLHDELAPLVGTATLGLAGFHYFTFNRLLDTWNWAQAQRHDKAVELDIQKEPR